PAQNMSGYELPLSTKKILSGEDQFITQIMPLKYLDAKVVLPLIKPLLSRQGTIFAPPSSDLLIVTDTKNNIRKVDKILDEIDIDISDEIIERLDLKHSAANVISPKLAEVLEGKYGKARKGTREVFFKIVPLERINAIIAVASSDIMMEIRSLISKIDHPTPEGKSLLNVYYLENANAEEMVKILVQTQKAMVTAAEREVPAGTPAAPQRTEAGGMVVGGKLKVAGEEISIMADKSTNSLIIYAKPDSYNAIKEMIKQLDIPRKQVFIQALIMEVSPDEDFQFGTEWSGFKDVGSLSSNKKAGVIAGNRQEGGALGSLAVGEGGTINLGSGFSLGMLGESVTVGTFTFPSLEIMIKAIETLRTTNILSRPQLMTLNNEKASINISTNRPFQTTSTILEGGGTSQNIEYRDVGIKLQITPHINKTGKIRLEISQEVSKLSGTVAENQPITLKRTIDTVVEVNNGSTIVIGGLIEEQRDFTRNTVPCLGGLPLFGWAFKSIGVADTKTNLLVFISPKVFESPEEADALSKEKKDYMDNERARNKDDVKKEEPFFMKYAPKSKEKQEEKPGK
ncbi:MAG: type II secretion system secretin GspD, partial [Candidatus Zixiibacteriota bacterium]